jgi:hypothetical protein
MKVGDEVPTKYLPVCAKLFKTANDRVICPMYLLLFSFEFLSATFFNVSRVYAKTNLCQDETPAVHPGDIQMLYRQILIFLRFCITYLNAALQNKASRYKIIDVDGDGDALMQRRKAK